MTFNTLEHRDVSEIDWMLEGRIGFVAGLTLPIGKPTEVDWMLDGHILGTRCGPR
jgi:hypothetical protein